MCFITTAIGNNLRLSYTNVSFLLHCTSCINYDKCCSIILFVGYCYVIGYYQWSDCGGTVFPFSFRRRNVVPLVYTIAVVGHGGTWCIHFIILT